jgi:transcriptional regulator with XRE-family HTH domain
MPSEIAMVDARVGRRLTTIRLLRGCELNILAEHLSLSVEELLAIEVGTRRAGANLLNVAARFFNVPVGYFFDFKENTKYDYPEKQPKALALVPRGGVRSPPLLRKRASRPTWAVVPGRLFCVGPGHQVVDFRRRPEVDELGQHVGEPGERIEAIQLTRLE